MKPLTALVLVLPLSAWAETGTLDAAGVPIHFTDTGQGEPVVFLHAFAGSSDLWTSAGLVPMDGFRTIAFDARGHGRSGAPEDPAANGAELVADVIRVMDARGVAAAHIVGYSMGAETALNLVTRHPGRVLSVVAAGSGWSGAEEAEVYGLVSAALEDAGTFGDFMAAMAPDPAPPEEEQAAGFALLQAHGIAPDQPAAPLAAVAASLPEIISLDAGALEAVAVPVLGIAGEHDPERARVEALAGVIPGFAFQQIDGTDHLGAPLTPAFADAVTAFLRQ